MPILTVRHLTRYRYRRPVTFGEHRMMFRPREGHDQRILSERLVIVPEPVSLRFVHDVFGNCVGVARFAGEADTLSFQSTMELDHRPAALTGDEPDQPVAPFPVIYGADNEDLALSIERRRHDPDDIVGKWADRFCGPDGAGEGAACALELLSQMTRAIHREFRYAGRLDAGTQTPLETLQLASGACRDFAELMIEAARHHRLAARFVTGYIHSGARPDRGGAGSRVGGGHTHAWVQVYLPRLGWVDFDPTNGIVGSTDLIRVAVARDSAHACPLSGSWNGELADYIGMDVEVDVRARRAPARLRRVA